MLIVLSTSAFQTIGLINAMGQAILFTLIVCIPIWKTGRMSYVDIGWPWGLVLLGLITFIFSDGYWLRSFIVSAVVVLIGLRMGLGALKMWRLGLLKKEFPRYQYQRVLWSKEGKDNTLLALQVDAVSQGLANTSFLALPVFIIASNNSENFALLELIGLFVWASAFILESIADFQKLEFLKKMKKEGKQRQVCNVGLWKYCRHPNYFFEWMVWNGLIIAAIPSWLTIDPIKLYLFGYDYSDGLLLTLVCMLYASKAMYTTLVYTTGAVPSEYYSAQKRPAYKEYQQTTNRFFPGPKKV
jgi:steroid 5-alpha reductase family enzyme|tara:strand:+ start:922 stop:1818 length:897 start_codon:yes stop_codon:yes gene_type:complete